MISTIQKQLQHLQRSKSDPYVVATDVLSSKDLECIEEVLVLQSAGFDLPSIELMIGSERWSVVKHAEEKVQNRFKELTRGQMTQPKPRNIAAKEHMKVA